MAMLAAMMAFFLFTGAPSPIDGFDEAMRRNRAIASTFAVVCVVVFFIMCGICVYSINCIRSKRYRPYITMVLTVLLAFLGAMLLGVMISGYSHERQMFLFESICFLVAGLIILMPLVSIIYFALAFALFGGTFNAGGLLTSTMLNDLLYIAAINIIVSWIIYALFKRYMDRERIIADQSRRDELTGAKNRHYLRDDFETHIGKEVYVMLCDIDDFKHFNDDYNHNVGDELLRQFYFALREAYGDECTYRYGGDEFLVVTSEFGHTDFTQKADKAKAQLADISTEGQPLSLTFSGGYVKGTPRDKDAFRTMMHRADENLLEAKRQGKNCIVGAD